jgi:diacylglycerol kinase (ATP)
VQRGARLVIAWGGDGTVNEVASALAFDEVPLGIIPSGSGNGLARELGVSRRPERAMADALAASPRPLDVGEINDRLFVNIAGLGVDAHVASQFNRPGNERRGLLTYVRITARTLMTYTPGDYRITTSNGARPDANEAVSTVQRSHAVLVTIANSAQFGNGACIGALLDDGLLDLVVVEERSRLATIAQLPKLFNSGVERIPGYSRQRIRQAIIESDRPMTFHVDGESVSAGTRLRVRVHPAALRVAVR